MYGLRSMATGTWLAGDPFWRVDTPIWKTEQTIYWPGGRPPAPFRFVVAHSSDAPDGQSEVRINNVETGEVLVQVSWDNGNRARMLEEEAPTLQNAALLEVTTRTTCTNAEGQLYSVYIPLVAPASEDANRGPLARTFELSRALRVPRVLLERGSAPVSCRHE